jgi:hypothetical protein
MRLWVQSPGPKPEENTQPPPHPPPKKKRLNEMYLLGKEFQVHVGDKKSPVKKDPSGKMIAGKNKRKA